jgi:hypothetical protein
MDHPEPPLRPLNEAAALYVKQGILKYRAPDGRLFDVALTPST